MTLIGVTDQAEENYNVNGSVNQDVGYPGFAWTGTFDVVSLCLSAGFM